MVAMSRMVKRIVGSRKSLADIFNSHNEMLTDPVKMPVFFSYHGSKKTVVHLVIYSQTV